MPHTQRTYRKLLQGAGAGLIATLPMTLFMRSAWKRLPADERYALPPRQVTQEVVGKHRFWTMKPGNQTVLTLALHFLFGAAVGSIYGMLEERIPMQGPVKGPLAGMAVWAGSYLGWIPALGILPPATEHPWRRNIIMVAAHVVWGMALGLLARITNSNKNYITIR